MPWDYEIEGDRIFNTSYILDRNGNEIGRYRKVQITRGEEINGISKGDDFPVFDLDFGKVGIMICFDNYYQESARILALNGAEMILYPLYGDTLKPQWEIKLKARAIDNSVYVAPCHIGSTPVNTLITFTGMVDPTGEVICKLEKQGSCKVVEVDFGKRVITCIMASKGHYEDLKQYLLRMRNKEAYKDIMKKIDLMEWDKIQLTQLPEDESTYFCLVSENKK